MATIPSTRGNPQASDIAVQTALPLVGSASREDLQATLGLVDAELAKLFEDRNILLAGGGTVTYVGTTVQFTEPLTLHINSQIAGGAPTIIDLAATTRTVSANNRMIYAVINRLAGTATVTDDAATLAAVTSANLEVVLIAKRIDDGTGVKRLYFRNGAAFNEGQSAPLGSAGSGSGSGEKNYIKAPDSAFTNWASSGAGVTVATTFTNADLPENATKTSGILITPVSGSDYAYTRFQIDDADKGKLLKLLINVKTDAAYADDDLEMQVWTNTLSDYSGSYTQINLDREAGIKKADSGTTQIWSYGATAAADYYEVRIKRNAGTDPLVISGALTGPGSINIAPVINDWVEYTDQAPYSDPSNVRSDTNVWYRVVGTNVEITGTLVFTGSTGATLTGIKLPNGWTIDTNVNSGNPYPNTNTNDGSQNFGTCFFYQSGTNWAGVCNGLSLSGAASNDGFGFKTSYPSVVASNVTFFLDSYPNNGDFFTFHVTLPVAELAGNGTVQIGPGPDVEYASNSDSSDADDLTSFVNGPQGSAGVLGVGGLTSRRIKRVNFNNAIQPGDNIILEIENHTDLPGIWTPMIGYTYLAGDDYAITPLRTRDTANLSNSSGVSVQQFTSTAVNVSFGAYANVYGGYTSGWDSYPGHRWRLKKVRSGALVGIKLADEQGTAGLVNPYSATQGVVNGFKYTPVLQTSSNLTSVTPNDAFVTRIGSIVHVQGSMSGTYTGAGLVVMTFNLPIASNFTVFSDLAGIVSVASANLNGEVYAEPTNDRVEMIFTVGGASSANFFYSYSYKILP